MANVGVGPLGDRVPCTLEVQRTPQWVAQRNPRWSKWVCGSTKASAASLQFAGHMRPLPLFTLSSLLCGAHMLLWCACARQDSGQLETSPPQALELALWT